METREGRWRGERRSGGQWGVELGGVGGCALLGDGQGEVELRVLHQMLVLAEEVTLLEEIETRDGGRGRGEGRRGGGRRAGR